MNAKRAILLALPVVGLAGALLFVKEKRRIVVEMGVTSVPSAMMKVLAGECARHPLAPKVTVWRFLGVLGTSKTLVMPEALTYDRNSQSLIYDGDASNPYNADTWTYGASPADLRAVAADLARTKSESSLPMSGSSIEKALMGRGCIVRSKYSQNESTPSLPASRPWP